MEISASCVCKAFRWHGFDEFAFEVDERGMLELYHDDKEVIDEAMFVASRREACGLPGFCGC